MTLPLWPQVSNGVTVRKRRPRVLHIPIVDADFVRFMTHSRSRHPGKTPLQWLRDKLGTQPTRPAGGWLAHKVGESGKPYAEPAIRG